MTGMKCASPECTVEQTGVCLLGNPAGQCQNLVEQEVLRSPLSVGAPVLPAPQAHSGIPPSLALGSTEASELMAARYCRVIGVIGVPNSGKTAALVSLYLKLSNDQLEDYSFADSRSLIAFEEISRGARRWTGNLPEQLTQHTKLAEERTAGFLHLRLRDGYDGQAFDFLMPDLPGEWTNSLIDENRTDRLGFLRSADAICLVIDGRQLLEFESRNRAMHRGKLLIRRVSDFLGKDKVPLFLVITRRDIGIPDAEIISGLSAEAAAKGFEVSVVHLASFSDSDVVTPGEGICDLIRGLRTSPAVTEAAYWPDSPRRSQDRSFFNYRNRG